MAVDRDGSIADTDRPAAGSVDGISHGKSEQAHAAVLTDSDGLTAAEYIRDYNKRVKESLQSESRAGEQSLGHLGSLSVEHGGAGSPRTGSSDLDRAEEPSPQAVDRIATDPAERAGPEPGDWSSLSGATDENGLTSAQYIRQHNQSIKSGEAATTQPDSGAQQARSNRSDSETDTIHADHGPVAPGSNPEDGPEKDPQPLDHTRLYTTLRETLNEDAPTAPLHEPAGSDHGDQQLPERASERESRPYAIHQSEIDLRLRSVESYDPRSGGNANDVFVATFEDGTQGAYKPELGEAAGLRRDIPAGEYWKREVAASRLDHLLGFDLIPTTTEWQGHKGQGSMQEWKEATQALPVDSYTRPEIERMAVLDYISGNTDRHRFNHLTDPHGRLIAIDHGCAFPEGTNDAIRSSFIAKVFDQPLGTETVDAVRSVEPYDLRAALKSAGLSESSIDGSLDRAKEIATNGTISGQAWEGMITDAVWNQIK